MKSDIIGKVAVELVGDATFFSGKFISLFCLFCRILSCLIPATFHEGPVKPRNPLHHCD
jgi:hypothetical protein